jgi:hypothetical protein
MSNQNYSYLVIFMYLVKTGNKKNDLISNTSDSFDSTPSIPPQALTGVGILLVRPVSWRSIASLKAEGR